MPVWTTHAEYDRMAPLWEKARDACSGQATVHAKGVKYLPKLKDQEDEQYDAYRGRANWFGASQQVVSGLKGMLFRRPPVRELPESLTEMLKNIDLSGTPLDVMANKCAVEILTVSRVGLLVDHPPALEAKEGAKPTQAQAEAANIRPTVQMYTTESIINWDYRMVRNAWIPCLWVLQEFVVVKDPTDRWKRTTEKRWRVLELDENDEYKVSVWRKRTPEEMKAGEPEEIQVGGDVYPLKAGQRLNFIPFFVFGDDDFEACPDEPVLMSLFDTNYGHYRVTADYENGCHFTGLPTPWIAGYSPEDGEDGKPTKKLYVGSSHAWVFPDPHAKAQYLEFNGQGLSELRANLDKKEVQMAIVGSRMLIADNKGRSNESATSVTVHRTGEASKLADIAIVLTTAFERVLVLFADWAGAGGGNSIKYTINRDFLPAGMDSNMVSAMASAVAQGVMSFDTFWELMQRGDVAPHDVTAAMEKERIKTNPEIIPKAPPKGDEKPSSEGAAQTGAPPPNV